GVDQLHREPVARLDAPPDEQTDAVRGDVADAARGVIAAVPTPVANDLPRGRVAHRGAAVGVIAPARLRGGGLSLTCHEGPFVPAGRGWPQARVRQRQG